MHAVNVTSISWIERSQLPNIGFSFLASASISWHKKVIMGLVATANPEPPGTLDNVDSFIRNRQFRALTHYSFNRSERKVAKDWIIDPGYTPPFDKSALDTSLLEYVPEFLLPGSLSDPKFYPGESSPLSGIESSSLHPSSTLKIPATAQVLASSLVKFRAGEHTDKIGIKDAGSPVHVPWVWCESALIKEGISYFLITDGSVFPSHAWYVNGEQVHKRLQQKLTDSEKEVAISTGRPGSQPRQPDNLDGESGSVDSHVYALGAGAQEKIDVSKFFR